MVVIEYLEKYVLLKPEARYHELLNQNELFFACDVIKEKIKKAYECTLPIHMGRVISSLIRFCLDSGNKTHLLVRKSPEESL